MHTCCFCDSQVINVIMNFDQFAIRNGGGGGRVQKSNPPPDIYMGRERERERERERLYHTKLRAGWVKVSLIQYRRRYRGTRVKLLSRNGTLVWFTSNESELIGPTKSAVLVRRGIAPKPQALKLSPPRKRNAVPAALSLTDWDDKLYQLPKTFSPHKHIANYLPKLTNRILHCLRRRYRSYETRIYSK